MTRTIRAAAIITALALLGVVGFRSMTAGANPVAGQYSMEVAVGETSVAVNSQFAAYVGIHHSGGSYQAAQWHIDYPETVVDVVSMAKDPGAPGECLASSDDGSRVLLGCIKVDSSSQMNFSCNAWIVGFKCIANGTANITVATGPTVASPTSVLNGQGTELAIHTHSDTVTCGAAARRRRPNRHPAANNAPSPKCSQVIRSSAPTARPCGCSRSTRKTSTSAEEDGPRRRCSTSS
jgi:hypothetical protein